MEKLFKLLETKNYWFKKYLAANEAFHLALNHEPEAALDELELFYGNRESLLRIIEDLENKVQKEAEGPAWAGEIDSAARTRVHAFIREKDSCISRIVQLDSQILKRMEVLREEGIEKMQHLAKGRKTLAKYRGAKNYNERLDKKI